MLIEHRYEIRGPRPGPFALYGSLSRRLPEAHGAGWAIAPCHFRSGFVIRGADIAPDPRVIQLRGRSVPTRIVESVELLPALDLWSPIVVIKLTIVPETREGFRAAVEHNIRERCAALGDVSIRLGADREIRVHGRRVRGVEVFARTSDLDVSAALLTHGIGGKRSMGCGVFHDQRSPWR